MGIGGQQTGNGVSRQSALRSEASSARRGGTQLTARNLLQLGALNIQDGGTRLGTASVRAAGSVRMVMPQPPATTPESRTARSWAEIGFDGLSATGSTAAFGGSKQPDTCASNRDRSGSRFKDAYSLDGRRVQ